MRETVSKALKLFGQVDILINNAGISYRGEISSTQIQVDERLMAVNYFGQIALIKGKKKKKIQIASSMNMMKVNKFHIICYLVIQSAALNAPFDFNFAEILPHMKEQGGGSIVGVSSVQGKIAIPYRSACKYKQAHTMFCEHFDKNH